MIIHEMEQGSEAWLQVRLGKVTASNFATAIAKPGSSTRDTYMRKLMAERLTGLPQATYSNANMDRGTELEPDAREHYSLITDTIVGQVGFVELNENTGVSPDGLIGEDGGIEIKCPLASTHIQYILNDKLPSTYQWQVHGVMWACDLKWIDFVSYCPEMTSRPIWIHRVERDEEKIAVLQVKIGSFIKEMNTKLTKIEETNF